MTQKASLNIEMPGVMSDLTKQSELKNELANWLEGLALPHSDVSVHLESDERKMIVHALRSEAGTAVIWNTRPASAGVREALEAVRARCIHYLDRLEFRSTGRDPKNNGFTFAAVPEWALRQEIERIDSALSDHGVQKSGGVEAGWRSIESAPRDGTGILVKLPDSDMPLTAKFWRGSWTVAWDHSELKGWDAPTHWMPIPELPSDSLLSKTLTEGEQKRPQIESSPANEGSSLSPNGGAV